MCCVSVVLFFSSFEFEFEFEKQISQESARDLFERVRHDWPAMPAFSFGGILGGEASVSDAINNANNYDSARGGGRWGGEGDEGAAHSNSWWRSLVRNPRSMGLLWMVAGGVLLAVIVALSGAGDNDVEGEVR